MFSHGESSEGGAGGGGAEECTSHYELMILAIDAVILQVRDVNRSSMIDGGCIEKDDG